jgi:hypothetical protein
MANRFNTRIDGGLLARLLIELLGGTVAIAVQGLDADDDPMTARPVAVGGKYIAAPTGDALDDGDAGYLLVDQYRRLAIAGGDADDAPATAKAVGVGGKYIADPFASPLSADGDFGEALINQIRMLVTEDRAYDAPTDANKEVPVWTQADRGDVVELTGSVAASGSSYSYFDLTGYGYFSCEFLPNAAGGGAGCTVDLSYQTSDEESQPDITLRAYNSDMSNAWFGAASFSSGAGGAVAWAHEKDTVTPWSSMRLKVTVAGFVAGTTATWTIRLRKIAM